MTEKEKFPTEWSEIRSLVRAKLQEKRPGNRDNWTHVSGGCESGASWRRNMDAYEGLGFVVKTIHGVRPEEVDLSVEILGTRWDLPVAVAPMSSAIHDLCENAFAELAGGVRAAGTAAGIGYPNGPEVHRRMVEAGAPVFRILKPLRKTDALVEALKSAEDAGCFAAGIDIDSAAGIKPGGDASHYGDLSRSLTREELREIRKCIRIPFILKGVMSTEDALAAMEIGADAIVVSNHAGYALDYCLSPLEVLPGIVRAVGGRMTILVDSGIRRGSDVLKALALGCDAVLIGRLAIWGLLMGCGEGLAWIFRLMAEEMGRIMVLTGTKKLRDLDRRCLVPLNGLGDRILGGRD
jgi:isopentenyl diphosphate isomerase/L-lactate dehydrogenase-like FMN-dependent dehydrogenase